MYVAIRTLTRQLLPFAVLGLITLALMLAISGQALAQTPSEIARQTVGNGEATADQSTNLAKTIVDTLSVIGGAVAVIAIIIGGLRYNTSGGDSGKVASAKNTIIYAVVGLIIIIFAQVIVNYVITEAETPPAQEEAAASEEE